MSNEICLSGKSHLEQRQKEIYNRFNSFCDKITKIIDSALNTRRYNHISIEPTIISEILYYSNHKQIQQIWISKFHGLRQLSFMISRGAKVQEIRQFELKCAQTLNVDHYQLPDILRISLLFSNSSKIPPIIPYNDKIQSYPDETAYYYHPTRSLETYLDPLSEWTINKIPPQRDDSDEEDTEKYSSYFNMIQYGIQNKQDEVDRVLDWFDESCEDWSQTFRIGSYGFPCDDWLLYYEMDLFLNIKTNEVLFHRIISTDGLIRNQLLSMVEFQNLFDAENCNDYTCRQNPLTMNNTPPSSQWLNAIIPWHKVYGLPFYDEFIELMDGLDHEESQ